MTQAGQPNPISNEQADDPARDEYEQVMAFTLRKDLYALQITHVKEVVEYEALTFVPGAPGYMRGVVNLRGNVVPVLDLKDMLKMGQTEHTRESRIIVCELEYQEEEVSVGIMADSVYGVSDIPSDSIEPPPRMENRQQAAVISGMGRMGDKFIIMLDLEKIFSQIDGESAEFSGKG